MTEPLVFDVTAADFEAAVVQRSDQVPILLDFWAEWCEPCRTLAPILERVAAEYGGSFAVGRVDSEAEKDLAYAFQVQGIPFGVMFSKGRPVDAFNGAITEDELRQFLDRCGIQPGTPEEDAETPEDPDAPEARLAAGLVAAAKGDVALARERLSGIADEEPQFARARHLLDGLEFVELDPASLDAEPAAAAIVAAHELYAGGGYEAAVERLLESMEADKGFRDGLARRGTVLLLELIGREPNAEDLAAALRRRMATLLY